MRALSVALVALRTNRADYAAFYRDLTAGSPSSAEIYHTLVKDLRDGTIVDVGLYYVLRAAHVLQPGGTGSPITLEIRQNRILTWSVLAGCRRQLCSGDPTHAKYEESFVYVFEYLQFVNRAGTPFTSLQLTVRSTGE